MNSLSFTHNLYNSILTASNDQSDQTEVSRLSNGTAAKIAALKVGAFLATLGSNLIVGTLENSYLLGKTVFYVAAGIAYHVDSHIVDLMGPTLVSIYRYAMSFFVTSKQEVESSEVTVTKFTNKVRDAGSALVYKDARKALNALGKSLAFSLFAVSPQGLVASAMLIFTESDASTSDINNFVKLSAMGSSISAIASSTTISPQAKLAAVVGLGIIAPFESLAHLTTAGMCAAGKGVLLMLGRNATDLENLGDDSLERGISALALTIFALSPGVLGFALAMLTESESEQVKVGSDDESDLASSKHSELAFRAESEPTSTVTPDPTAPEAGWFADTEI